MTGKDEAGITRWLAQLREGDKTALNELMPALYSELRKVARRLLRGEREGHTLHTTALVNEAYLKLSGDGHVRAEDRNHFFAIAAHAMRQVLVDHARGKRRVKRGDGAPHVSLDDVEYFLTDKEADEILALDAALERLAAVNPRGSQVVEHRYFAGLTLDETAEVLGVSKKTVQRDWLVASAWLRKEVRSELD